MHHRFGLEVFQRRGKEVVVRYVAHKKFDRLAGQVLPYPQAFRERADGRERLRAKFVIPLAAQKVIDNRDRVSFLR